ncbi:glycogen debranching protein [Streptomyces montanisoli]|uniref:Glycogen debranching protein n=1 Tax=Streptomyces montanisoli TaxID=2798581 RepID=A0A940RVP5_9ACTN|nr:alpha-amylase family glycosyl hydrolase [Streptomyces montanisoli]MBP0456293.1 glycogen debranching protein [Streptomyces montanisoli]
MTPPATAAGQAPPLLDRLCVGPGRAQPFGATPVAGAVNFAVHARGTPRLWLVLMDPGTGTVLAEYPFPDEGRVGTVHTIRLYGAEPGSFDYGYRVEQPTGARSPVLLDPYARGLAGAGAWGERPRYRSRVLPLPGPPAVPRPLIDPADLVIYEAHVRGFSRDPSSGVSHPGTFAGLREKIPYLRELGVNCVELLPIAEFDESDNTYTSPESGAPLPNYWGYNTVGFAAPKSAYAADPTPAGADAELRETVGALHRSGIQVVLDVVFNHTAEGGRTGPMLSFRGLDEPAYYLLTPDGEPLNITATGNTVNAGHPITSRFILDCLRDWVTRYDVDGFRFDMASILTRGADGRVMDDPPLLAAVAHDPVLAGRLLIAEATDATGLDQVGSFPGHGRWSEWNGRYRDAVRRFLLGRRGSAGEFATRFVGSPDLYTGRPTTASVNYITCHDGLTLADWTSYDRRHNEDNGEGGDDGIPDEESWNCGYEGPTDDHRVLRLREQQRRNALLLLLTSAGVPMLLAGDEFGRTQRGNNNAYSQDSPVSWLNWSHTGGQAALLRFVSHCVAFRRAHPVLRRTTHPDGALPDGWSYPPVSWHGETPGEPDWHPSSTLLAVMLHQQQPVGTADTVYLAANTGGARRTVRLPGPPPGTRWHLSMDTGAPPPLDSHPPGREPALVRGSLQLAGHSVVALTAR